MGDVSMQELVEGIKEGNIIPYLGPGALDGSKNTETGEPIPADSESLILSMNNGKPMAPRLMYEFPRAAMDVELKKGRNAVHRFLEETYAKTSWTRAAVHDWLATLKPHYIIDINRDTQLQDSYKDTPHLLIRGIARIGGTDYRFKIHHYDGEKYSTDEVDQNSVDTSLPILFKPMGSPLPDSTYIASDADYVDYITELMGGFAIPDFIKQYRKNKQYLFIGLPMTRDTERMVLSDFIYAASEPVGWAFIRNPNEKEKRFCKKMHIEILDADISELINDGDTSEEEPLTVVDVGC